MAYGPGGLGWLHPASEGRIHNNNNNNNSTLRGRPPLPPRGAWAGGGCAPTTQSPLPAGADPPLLLEERGL